VSQNLNESSSDSEEDEANERQKDGNNKDNEVDKENLSLGNYYI